ncbi:MAG: HAMP domain-containing histidine kinase, partial [Candidatus Riflebacteria bacterium]|nr:HAMP domain-containing histidine kinase [Candidatus Riflebacteria bacterium]
MSRIESHRKELILGETNLKKVIDEVSDIFAGDMEAKQIKYTVKIENLTNPLVMCDKNCLSRVLFNILGNALKFTPEKGEIILTLCQSAKEENIGKYTISIKDNGIGISEEFFPKLFKAFEREKTSTESGLHGTGLGLSISKSIIDLM